MVYIETTRQTIAGEPAYRMVADSYQELMGMCDTIAVPTERRVRMAVTRGADSVFVSPAEMSRARCSGAVMIATAGVNYLIKQRRV